MKTGIELITQERSEQLKKHGRTVEKDVQYNHGYFIDATGEELNIPQLPHAASQLICNDEDIFRENYEYEVFYPHGWDKNIWLKMMAKPYKERLIIAGALIAAEIDRIQYKKCNHKNTCDAGGVVVCYDCGKTLVDW